MTSVSTESTEDESARPATGAAAGGSLLTGSAGDRCAVCDARLAIDQRYCVECGTRRGNPRFTLAQTAPEPGAIFARPGELVGAAITRLQLLLALLIVLVAIGVGVLIGHGTSSTPQIRVIGGSVASGHTGTGTSGSSSSKGGSGNTGSSGGNLFNSGG